jgi:hypothetical protein
MTCWTWRARPTQFARHGVPARWNSCRHVTIAKRARVLRRRLPPGDYVFTFENGRPPHPDTIRQRFDDGAAKFTQPGCRGDRRRRYGSSDRQPRGSGATVVFVDFDEWRSILPPRDYSICKR